MGTRSDLYFPLLKVGNGGGGSLAGVYPTDLAWLRVEQRKPVAFYRLKMVLEPEEKVQSTSAKGDGQKVNSQLLRVCNGVWFGC